MTRRTAEEQQAAYQAALGASPAGAAASWSPPPGALPQVLIHLSPFVDGLADRPVSHDDRWRWMVWVTPAQIIRRVLLRISRRADQIALRAAHGTDGVDILDRAVVEPDGERLLAIVFDTPAAALRLAWAALMPSAEIERHAIEGATVLTLKPKEAA